MLCGSQTIGGRAAAAVTEEVLNAASPPAPARRNVPFRHCARFTERVPLKDAAERPRGVWEGVFFLAFNALRCSTCKTQAGHDQSGAKRKELTCRDLNPGRLGALLRRTHGLQATLKGGGTVEAFLHSTDLLYVLHRCEYESPESEVS